METTRTAETTETTLSHAATRCTHGTDLLELLGRSTTDDSLQTASELVRVGRMFDDSTLLDYYATHIDTMPALQHDTSNARIMCARRVLVATAGLIVRNILGVD